MYIIYIWYIIYMYIIYIIYIYIYDINVMNPNTRALDVLNKSKAELVVSSSWWMKEMITVSTD